MRGRNFEMIVPDSVVPHETELAVYPGIQDWPDDEFSRWVVSHRAELRDLVCTLPLHSNGGFCTT